MKICIKCKNQKSLTDFYKHPTSVGGRASTCKDCKKLYAKKQYANPATRDMVLLREKRKYQSLSPEERLQKSRKSRQTYSEWYKQYNKKYYLANREYLLAEGKKWRDDNENVEHQRAYARQKYKKYAKDPKKKLRKSISCLMRYSLHKKGLSKNGMSWEKLIGYTTSELKDHLESQFTEGMTWDNHGKWHIDHIIPISFFQFTSSDDVEFKMCWRLENLRPMWAMDNIMKSNKITRVA